jgi:hypothetical protein
MNSYSTLPAYMATPVCSRILDSAFRYSSVLRCFCEAFRLLTRSLKNLSAAYRLAHAAETPL